MFYQEYQPCAALADFVKCFWIMEATHNPFQGKESLIPDGCIELIFNYKYLERQFLKIIGLTPKSYSRIARFQNVMQALKYAAFHPWPSLALDCGYYDQAHFIKEFKAFTGATPSEFVARQNQIAEMLTAPGNV
jgi:methylphosphotriester-DNA--protein-cysteine methyltransferase